MTIDKSDEVDYIKLTTEVLKTCENEAIDLNAITSGVVSDIPVLLATLIVELYISHLIKLPEETSNIDTIKNRVLVTSCKFLQGPNVLFIKGFIRKKIYYDSKTYENSRYYKVDIPFECTTTIILNKTKASPILDNNGAKVEYSKENKVLSNNLPDFKQIPIEFFNNQPFCELISSKITEQYKYIYKDDKDYHVDPLGIKEIIEIDNNMAIMLEIQILQNQQVNIKPYCTDKQEPSSDNKADIKNQPTLDSLYNEPDDDTKLDLTDNANLENESNLFDKTDIENKPSSDNLYNKPDNDKLDLIDIPNLEDKSILNDKTDIENKPALDSLYNESDNDKLNLIDIPNLEDKSILNDKADIENKPALDSLYNEPDNDKLDLIDLPNLEDKSILNDKTDIENKPALDSLYNESNYNHKLDLDYLLNFYYEPDNKLDLTDNANLENKSNPYDNVHIDDKPVFNNLSSLFNKSNNGSEHDLKDKSNLENRSNLYNRAPINNKLDFISLFSLFNRSNSVSNHDFKDKPNLQNKSNLYNKTPINNRSHFNNYHTYDTKTTSRSSYSSYNYRSNSYKLLIIILCIFILYNMNNHNSYL